MPSVPIILVILVNFFARIYKQFVNPDEVEPEEIYIASKEGNAKLIKEWLNKDPDLDLNRPVTNSGSTALMIACSFHNFEVVQLLLLEGNVDLELKDHQGRTAFFIACEKGNTKIVKEFLKYENVNINCISKGGWTPLIISSFHGYLDIVKLLLNKEGLDINAGNDYGETSFYFACMNGKVEVVKVLLNNHNLDINKTNNRGVTPLSKACYYGHLEIVEWILVSQQQQQQQQEVLINQKTLGATTKIEIINLLESFIKNPKQVRIELREKLGYLGQKFLSFLIYLFI